MIWISHASQMATALFWRLDTHPHPMYYNPQVSSCQKIGLWVSDLLWKILEKAHNWIPTFFCNRPRKEDTLSEVAANPSDHVATYCSNLKTLMTALIWPEEFPKSGKKSCKLPRFFRCNGGFGTQHSQHDEDQKECIRQLPARSTWTDFVAKVVGIRTIDKTEYSQRM